MRVSVVECSTKMVSCVLTFVLTVLVQPTKAYTMVSASMYAMMRMSAVLLVLIFVAIKVSS